MTIFIINIFDDSSWIWPKINWIWLDICFSNYIASFSLTASTAVCCSSFSMVKLFSFSGANRDFAITNLQIMSSWTITLLSIQQLSRLRIMHRKTSVVNYVAKLLMKSIPMRDFTDCIWLIETFSWGCSTISL